MSDEASRILSDGNLHQWLWLPQTSSHERLRVTFSTTTNFSNTNLPALLFCGPMFSSRWMVLDLNRLAAENSVRLICTDRPGMGGSTRVPLNIRVQVWLETVPILLKKLNVEHVGLLCHSTGIIYASNTVYHLRDVLDPRAPYLACVAPWVNSEQPPTALMKVVSKIPNGMFDYWHDIIRFAQQRVAPAATWSGGLVSSMVERTNSGSFAIADKYGTTEDVAKELERLRTSYIFLEDITGADEDVRLCLRKEGYGNWGVCEDYAEFVRNLAQLEREGAVSRPDQGLLMVDAYFASSDIIIGKYGQNFFEQSWRQHGVAESIVFESRTLDGTNHDSLIIDPKKGAMGSIFNRYAQLRILEGASHTRLESISVETTA